MDVSVVCDVLGVCVSLFFDVVLNVCVQYVIVCYTVSPCRYTCTECVQLCMWSRTNTLLW